MGVRHTHSTTKFNSKYRIEIYNRKTMEHGWKRTEQVNRTERSDSRNSLLAACIVFNNHEKMFEHPPRVYYFRGDRNEIKHPFDRSSNSRRMDTLEEELRIL